MHLTGVFAALLGVILWAASPGFARAAGSTNEAGNADSASVKVAESSLSAGTSDVPAVVSLEPVSAGSAPAARPAARAQTGTSGPAGAGAGGSSLAPVAATSGGLGLFTLETGQLLPKKGWTASAFANKFTRMPGTTTLLQFGLNAAVGVTDWLNLSVAFNPYQHVSVRNPGQLSLNAPLFNPQFPGSVYRVLPGSDRPGYVEDFPFASHSSGGVGPVTIGVKLGVASQENGAPLSLAIRNDFVIPTQHSLSSVLQNGTQSGEFNYRVAVMASRNWSNNFILTASLGALFTIDPDFKTGSSTVHALDQAQQILAGAGFIIFPQSRIQLMSEYNAIVFMRPSTPNNSFGARDPVDGIWGVRLYPWRQVSIDAGYRYMLNLSNATDRHGFVIKLGMGSLPAPPPPVNRSPVAACSLDKSSVFAGSDDVVIVSTTASDPDSDPLNYSWTATGGRVDGTGAQVRWLSAGVAPGNYTITANVDDGRGGMTTCSVETAVAPRPNRPPTVTLTSDRDTAFIGERFQFTAAGADPDSDPLTYIWRTNCGQLNAANTSGTLDTAGVAAGTCTVTVRVEDGRGGAADASKAVNLQAPPPPPEASRLNSCDFMPANSSRVDNVCKRILDDVALRLQNEPRATVVVVGFADPGAQAARVAGSRGENTAAYLTERGVDRSRITTRTGAGQAGAGQQNRRVDIIWVPEGATY